MIVMGVDPGTRSTGYGIVSAAAGESPALVECGVVRTSRGAALSDRLLEIFEGIGQILGRARPDVLSVEGIFYSRNVRTTVVLGHARGAVLLAGATQEVPVVEYPPAEIKNAIVGTGMARKEQVAFMVQKHLRLEEPPSPADAADGLAVALCHVFESSRVRVEPDGASGGGVGRKFRN